MGNLKEKVLRLTSSFEGGWGALAGNFDGQVLSYGPLQWNIGQGTLEPLLKRIYKIDPSSLRDCLGSAGVQALLDGGFEGFVRSVILDASGKPKPVWYGKFARLSISSGAKQAFIFAADPYYQKAQNICIRLQFKSERGYALAFDIAVQNGGLRSDHIKQFKSGDSPELEEFQRLKLLAHAVADHANPRWRGDVLARKLCIALGSTSASGRLVHGKSFDIAKDFDIAYQREWRS